MRTLAILASCVGLLLCIGTAATGIYWGAILHGADPTWRSIHLDFAISCVLVSMFAHSLAIHFLRKSRT